MVRVVRGAFWHPESSEIFQRPTQEDVGGALVAAIEMPIERENKKKEVDDETGGHVKEI